MIVRFDYECPNMFNEADFVISILNSDSEKVKRDVEEMCKLYSTDQQINFNYDLFNSKVMRLNNWVYIITDTNNDFFNYYYFLEQIELYAIYANVS